MAFLKREIPESGDVSLVYIDVSLYPTSFHKGFYEAVAQVQWVGKISIVLPAEPTRNLQNRQMLIEHNPDPHQEAH